MRTSLTGRELAAVVESALAESTAAPETLDLTKLTDAELKEWLLKCRQQLDDFPDSEWATGLVRDSIDEIKAEMARRRQARAPDVPARLPYRPVA